MDNARKRHRQDEVIDDANPEEVAEVNDEEVDVLAVRLRRRIFAMIISLIIVMDIFMLSRNQGPIVPQSVLQHFPFLEANDEEQNENFQPAIRFQNDVWARIIAIDQFSVDPTRRSEQPFWDTYRGREEDWYKEYRMSQRTFNTIVRDCVPFFYSRPTYSLKSARFRYLRAKVVMATLIRYLAIQSDQHTLGKEFGVRQPCVSKRIDRGCKALLSAYWFEKCPYPKITFPLHEGRIEAARWFYRKCNIPYLCGSIDGSKIKIASPHCVNFKPREFWCKRKKTYSVNLMVVCDHQKKIIFADARWPGSTSDTGAVSRSKFLTNLFVRRDPDIFPQPFMILSDGGFHKRSCFIAPDLVAHNQLENQFNTRISSARCLWRMHLDY